MPALYLVWTGIGIAGVQYQVAFAVIIGILALNLHPDQRRPAIHVAGELDISNTARLTALADQVLAAHPTQLLLDLQQVTFVGAAGVIALLTSRAAASVAGTELQLRDPAAIVRRVLDLTATTTLFAGLDISRVDSPNHRTP